MKIEAMVDEARLAASEREDHAANLERAIALGHVKRQPSDVSMLRMRFPTMRAAVRALQLIAAWRAHLPAEFVAEVEKAP